MRRSVPMFQHTRHDSAYDGAATSVAMVSASAPIAWRSKWPRIGSRRQKARITKIAVGTMRTMNGTRQLNQDVRSPASSGPRHAPTASAARWTEYTFGRSGMS